MYMIQSVKTNRRTLLVGVGAAVAGGSVFGPGYADISQNLWADTIGELLGQQLWTDRDIYDASHNLMIPMHLAFSSDEYARWQADYASFFEAFLVAWQQSEFTVEGALNRGQFLWLVSRYLRLKSERMDLSAADHELLGMLVEEHQYRFVGYPVSIYPSYEFATVQESIEWKLSDPDTEYTYQSLINDSNRSTLSIAADLFAMQPILTMPDEVFEARELGLSVLRERSAWGEDGGWQFNFGALWDHPDFAFAGQEEPSDDMEPAPIPGIGEDTSHHHRVPLMLASFDPGNLDSEVSAEISAMREGLAIQFVNHVLVFPDDEFPGIRTRNYMDGRNGLYRWNYETNAENDGYLPYQLSSTFTLGWWALLDDETVREAYSILADRFPLTDEEIDLYTGPNTTRDRNPLFRIPEAYSNGMKEITVQCAALLGS